MELIDREHLLVDVASLKQSPWFNRGKNEQILHGVYLERKEAVETVEDLCIKSEPTVEAIPKDQYETRLKADLKAIFVELQLEIEELDFFEGEEPVNITQELMDEAKNWEHGVKDCKKIIQQKIDKLGGSQK